MHDTQTNRRDATILLAIPLIAAVLAPAAALKSAEPPSADHGQLGSPLSWIEVEGASSQFYLAQETRDGRLYLTANEAFFPNLGLTAAGNGTIPDIENLNGGKSFARIEGWGEGDASEWGVLFRNAGELECHVWMTSATAEGQFALRFADAESAFATRDSSGEPMLVATVKFQVDQPGRHSLQLICNRPAGEASLCWIEISGPAAEKGAVLRKRWRPAAAHTKFSSSKSNGRVRLWVMEMDAVPGSLGFYCPITTPFGYYGPTWQANGTVNTSFNFSLWSYGRGQPEPPVEQLSHLLAVGDRRASFGGFGHEGTGVKIRGWEPLAGRQGQRQALALRVEPGETYDTYYSYFFAADEQRWRLFGVGNKYNRRRPLESLWVGSFVEVPGPPHVQRTGPYRRTMRYRGWIMEEDGSWYPLDRMTNGNVDRDTGLTHSDRGVTDDGWFYLATGGWSFRKPALGDYVELPVDAQASLPAYLSANHIASLRSVPAEISLSAADRTENRLQGSYFVRNAADTPQVTLYWGTAEALTLADRWEHAVELPAPREGENRLLIENLPSEGSIYLRLLLENSEGRFWSRETLEIPPGVRSDFR